MQTVSICPNCGSRNTGEVANCLRCQTPLPAPQEASAPAPDAAQTPVTTAPAPPQPLPVPTSTRSAGCGARVWVIVAVLALLLVMVWVGVYVFSNWPPTGSSVAPPVGVGGSPVTETPVTLATTCLSNVKQLALAALMYAGDHDGKLPTAAWVAELEPYLKNASILRCPSRPDLQVACAMNEKLVGGALLDIASPTETIMFFETAVAAPSPVGGPDLVPAGGIHNGGLHVAYADGAGKWVPVDQVKSMIAGGNSVTEPPVSGISYGAPDLDSYVGTWEFVGEPGPWGEGLPFSLERSGNILVGAVGLPEYYDHAIRLRLTAGNDELLGESTTVYADGETEVMALRMAHDGDLLEVTFWRAGGEGRIRAARRTAAAGE